MTTTTLPGKRPITFTSVACADVAAASAAIHNQGDLIEVP
jgi:hypothetical protein